MPTYQYKCSLCGYELEKFQTMLETKITKCPKCGKNTLQRLIGSGSGIIFKGSGFYETDYKNKASTPCPSKTCTSKPEPIGDSNSCSCCPHKD